jgi:hypothetical protein
MFDSQAKEYNPEFNELGMKQRNILNSLGYENVKAPSYVLDLTEKLLSETQQRVSLRAGFRILPVEQVIQSVQQIVISQIVFNLDKMIYGLLKNSEYIALFTVTAGHEFSKWFDLFSDNGDPLESYIIDTIGSETAELTADLLEEKIKKLVKSHNLYITNRYSPGYCNWHVSEQHKLFSLLPENFCGITLNPSGLMIPIKSVSGVIGIGSNVKRIEYLCSICSMENCYKRKYLE